MIGRLRGVILEKRPPHLLLEVQGVGYELEAPMTTFYTLPEVGREIQLFTHLTVREDAHLLFGFASENERRMFRSLIKVSGIGVRMALTILSGIEAADFAVCVRRGDSERLIRLPGVGKKTAERLIMEMRDRLADWELTTAAHESTAVVRGHTEQTPAQEAESALIALGYKPQEASRYVHAVATPDMNSETIIREALKASVNK